MDEWIDRVMPDTFPLEKHRLNGVLPHPSSMLDVSYKIFQTTNDLTIY